MPAEPLTLMAVHAHPDDECISTGGTLARYAAEGVRTVLVVCTDGRCGDGPDGVKPGAPGHDPAKVAAQRAQELERSCRVLGVSALERLGYGDSGMMGWATNSAPGALWGQDVLEAAAPLVRLMRRYRPQVVVTYDANGFYGHPDHIMAHRLAVVAAAATGIPVRLFYTAMPRSALGRFADAMREAGFEPPELPEGPGPGDRPAFGTPDALVTTTVDVRGYTAHKREALQAHASQADNLHFLRMPPAVFDRLFEAEAYTLAFDRAAGNPPTADLFDALR